MHGVIVVLAWVLAGLCAAAAAVGAWAWWYLRHSRAFWLLVRAGQGAAVLLAAAAGVAAVTGHAPDDGLFWVYALVPVAVGFFAEQLRIVSAAAVLEARGLPDTAAVGQLADEGQRSVVVAVLRRETGVMALAAAVTVFLAVRAVATAAGL